MKEMNKIQNQIEHYIQGQLTEQEVDALWAEFLKTPELYDYYLTVINLQALFHEKSLAFQHP